MKPNEATGNQEIMHRLKNAGELYVLLSCVQENPMWSATRKHMMMKS